MHVTNSAVIGAPQLASMAISVTIDVLKGDPPWTKSEQDWGRVKGKAIRLYQTEGKTLKETHEILKSEDGLQAT